MPELQLFSTVHQKAWLGEIDFVDGNVKGMLLANTYTPARETHDYLDDISANEITGTGYTAGGQALVNPALTVIDDASATAWVGATEYQLGDIVRPSTANGYVYLCVSAGTSGAGEPTWPTTRGGSVSDNTVTWLFAGISYLKVDADNPSWASSTITARYYALYYNTGVGSTSPLIGLLDFGQDESSSNGTFSVAFDPTGILGIPLY